MFKKSKSDSKSYGIIGLGRFGSALAVELAKSGAEPLVIDGNEEKVREMREYTENAFVVSSFDKKTLSETGIQNCDVVVVCIGEKMDTSILTTLNVVSLGVPTVISKAASAEQGEILKKLGAEVVYPERDMAVRLAHKLETPNMLDFVQLSRKLNLLKLEVPRKIVGMTIMSADMRGRFGVNMNAFVVSSFDKKTLSETGIQNCDVVVVCIGEKMDTSILTTLNVVSLGVPTVISKAASAEQGEILKKLGAEVVYPERDMAVRLAHKLETPNMLDFVQLSRKLNLLKLEVPRKIVGMTIMSADMRGRFGVNIIAIENNGNLTDNVHPDYMFREGDILYAVGSEKSMTRLSDWMDETR